MRNLQRGESKRVWRIHLKVGKQSVSRGLGLQHWQFSISEGKHFPPLASAANAEKKLRPSWCALPIPAHKPYTHTPWHEDEGVKKAAAVTEAWSQNQRGKRQQPDNMHIQHCGNTLSTLCPCRTEDSRMIRSSWFYVKFKYNEKVSLCCFFLFCLCPLALTFKYE